MDRESAAGEAKWIAIVRGVARRWMDNQIPGRAAQMSFYFFLSAFPMLLILVAVLGIFSDGDWLVSDSVTGRLASVVPTSVVRLLGRLLDHLAGQSGQPLTWGILLLLWSASSGMVATIGGLNLAYDLEESRPWWKRRLLGLALTLVLMLSVAAAMLLMAYGVPVAEALAQYVGLGSALLLAWRFAAWPIIFTIMLLTFDLLYHFAPCRPHARWRWLQPGTLIAIALWLVASLGLKIYATNFADYNVAYGSLGAVIVLLLWFYLTAIVILAGAEINAQHERATSA